MSWDCKKARFHLDDFLSGDIIESEGMRNHLNICEKCREKASILAGLQCVIKQEQEEVSNATIAKVMAKINTPSIVSENNVNWLDAISKWITNSWHLGATVAAIGLLIFLGVSVLYEDKQIFHKIDKDNVTDYKIKSMGPNKRITSSTPQPDKLQVLIARNKATFFAVSGQRVIEKERFALYSSTKLIGYVMVIFLDNEGQTTVLHPYMREKSVPINIGENQLLGQFQVPPGKACDWLVAIFSEIPLESSDVKELVSQSKRTLEDCNLIMSKPDNVRSITIFSLRR